MSVSVPASHPLEFDTHRCSFALERYVDETLLKGAIPAAEQQKQKRTAQARARAGLLEVRFEDLERALGEVRPTGSSATRAELAGKGRGLPARAALGLRGWRRRARLRKLVKGSVAESE